MTAMTTTTTLTTTTTSNVDRALYYAARVGDVHEVQRLVQDEKANIEFSYSWIGQTPLWIACCFGHTAVVDFLTTKQTANLECNDKHGRTPFFLACETGQFNMVQLLYDKGANTHACDHLGRSPFLVACEHDNLRVAEFLCSLNHHHSNDTVVVDVNHLDHQGQSALHLACAAATTTTPSNNNNNNNSLSMARFLLQQAGVAVNAPSSRTGQTALHLAVAANHAELVRLLVAHGASFHVVDQQGRTPLCMALDSLEMTYFLLREHNLWNVWPRG